MKTITPTLFLIIGTFIVFPYNLFADPKETLHRYALIAGANDGGVNRVKLRYAHTDAKAVARVLHQLGGVKPEDTVMLLEPDRFYFEAGIARIHNILKNTKQSGMRQELVIYFSGHSDEQGLMLGDDLVSYHELREAIQGLPADVRIAIVDSCSSGVLTRGKGGTRHAPFLLDTSVNVKGNAFLTSASADESAQESDRVGGSFFTHFLVSGLRGAADHNQDKKVTLNEAYQYAFNETLARTESTQAGPQHPGYDFQLRGSGDLVLTDLRGTSAIIEVAPSISGRLFIRNHKGQLVAEINKNAGQSMSLGLDPGNYDVTLDQGDTSKRGIISLRKGQTATLGPKQLDPTPRETTVARGNPMTLSTPAPPPPELAEKILTHEPFRIGFFPGVAVPYNRTPNAHVVNQLALNFIGTGDYLAGGEFGLLSSIRHYDIRGAQLSSIFNLGKGNLVGAQGAGMFNYIEGTVTGAQGALIFNIARSGVRGAQGASIFNYSGEGINGFAGSGIANIVIGPMKGFEGAGIVNLNTRTSHGFQGAGILNMNGASAHGFQGAGIANFNSDSVWGFQGAGILNISAFGSSSGGQFAGVSNYVESMNGAQISGIVNMARDRIRGAQIGLVNVAGSVRGAQVGLVNIARHRLDGASVGLINYAANGIFAPTIWFSDSPLINMGLKMGGPNLYSLFGVGVHPIGDDPLYTLVAGFGGHIDLGRAWLDLDMVWHKFISKEMWDRSAIDFMTKFRPTIGFEVLEQLSLFAGPTCAVLVSDTRDNAGWMPGIYETTVNTTTNLQISIGFTAGLQYEPRWGEHNTQ